MSHRYTPPLPDNEGPDGLPIDSDGYRLIELVEKYWVVKGRPLRLDDWQKHLLIRILERCPETHTRGGELRYRQVVVSIPRQAGKSLLAAILSLYGLLQHCHSPKVLGVARAVAQANIVYGYTADAIYQSDGLSSVLRPTGTRGISQVHGLGSYKVLPAKMEAIQGYESTLSICDELHVMKPEIWDAIVESQRAQTNPLLIGITTAGDLASVLLKRLYEQGEAAIAGGQEAFGFFVYESSSEELTLESITDANPAVACGRISAEVILSDCKGQPSTQWMRFTLNRFVDGMAEPWVPIEAWAKCAGKGLEDFKDVIYSIEVADAYRYATVSAYKKVDGIIKRSVVCRLVNPDTDALKAVVMRLRKRGRCTFVMDGYKRTRFLAEFCEDKGYDVIRVGTRRAEAANMAYAAILRGEVEHDGWGLANGQHAVARIKNQGDTFVVVSNGADIDAAYADVFGIYAAEIYKRKGLAVA